MIRRDSEERFRLPAPGVLLADVLVGQERGLLSMRPRLFIGSSVESLDIAYAIQENLERDCDPTVWTQGVFDLSTSTLDSLLQVLDRFDNAVFVFSPDDLATIRGDDKAVARDNVVFELGLFVGRLGRDKCFFVVPRNTSKLHIPTDLLGITPLEFSPDRDDANLVAALGPACNKMRRTMGISPLRNRSATDRDVMEQALLSTIYKLFFRDDRAKIVRFWPDGEIADGKNNNEHSWRIEKGKLELLNSNGEIHSRFRFDPASKHFFIERSPEIKCPYEQHLEPLK